MIPGSDEDFQASDADESESNERWAHRTGASVDLNS